METLQLWECEHERYAWEWAVTGNQERMWTCKDCGAMTSAFELERDPDGYWMLPVW